MKKIIKGIVIGILALFIANSGYTQWPPFTPLNTTIGPQDYWWFRSPLTVEILYIGESNGVIWFNGRTYTNMVAAEDIIDIITNSTNAIVTITVPTNTTYGIHITNGINLITSSTNNLEFGTFRVLR